MKKTTLLLTFLFTTILFSQSTWKKINLKNFSYRITSKGTTNRSKLPKKYHVYNLDVTRFKTLLKLRTRSKQKTIQLPSFSGKIENFTFYESTNFQEGLIQQFPNIKTYQAQSISSPEIVAKFSIGSNGVYVILFSPKHGTLYIDPFSRNKSEYIVYNHKYSVRKKFDCQTHSEIHDNKSLITEPKNNSATLKTFRLAMACTNEFSEFHLNELGIKPSATTKVKKEAILSVINTLVTRVNQIYERDLGIRLLIVNKNDRLLNVDLNKNDNLSNDSSDDLINESQDICDTYIGTKNYDIGHTVSTGGGGLANLGVVCDDNFKAYGVTGTEKPINDAFNVDYVAHEIGHQFGATHTFGVAEGVCKENRNASGAAEAGSGSTIMGYAGLCEEFDVQKRSDDYFHTVSISQITSILKTYNCVKEININNRKPKAEAGKNYSVPKGTPLILKGNANDPDNDFLTYCWEQMDKEKTTTPPKGTNTVGPSFRSFLPTIEKNRYLPRLKTVVNGNLKSTWEVLPNIARDLNFSLTVRDNHPGGGATDTDAVKINVVDIKPFIVTSQNTNEKWSVGENQKITWDVSETRLQPINCKFVTIKLSIDKGRSFPIILAKKVANNGSYTIKVPNNTTEEARIMVIASDNIFYNINSKNISINNDFPVIVNLSTNDLTTCNTNNEVSFSLKLKQKNWYNGMTKLSIIDLPQGITAKFSPNNTISSGVVEVKLKAQNNFEIGNFPIKLLATANGVNLEKKLNLNIYSSEIKEQQLIFPENNSQNIDIQPTFVWNNSKKEHSYTIEIAKDKNFKSIITKDELTSNFYSLKNKLKNGIEYFWRINTKNICGTTKYSVINKFTTTDKTGYCKAFFKGENSQYITKFEFNELINNTTDEINGYGDYSKLQTTIEKSKEYQLIIEYKLRNSPSQCSIYFDWNQNYIFEENEKYSLGKIKYDGELIKNIFIPNNAIIGSTRCRVVLEDSSTTSNRINSDCFTGRLSDFGEVEDYSLFIIENPTDADGDGNPNETDPNIHEAKVTDDELIISPNKTYGEINVLANDDFLPTTISSLEVIKKGTTKGSFSVNKMTGEILYEPLFQEIGKKISLNYKVCHQSVCKEATLYISVKGSKFNDNKFFDGLKIYPNPVSNGEITLRSNYDINNLTIRLYDVNGRLIEQKNVKANDSNVKNIKFENHHTGIYLLMMILDNRSLTKKVLFR